MLNFLTDWSLEAQEKLSKKEYEDGEEFARDFSEALLKAEACIIDLDYRRKVFRDWNAIVQRELTHQPSNIKDQTISKVIDACKQMEREYKSENPTTPYPMMPLYNFNNMFPYIT